MSSSISSQLNTSSNTNKNPFIHESSEKFYKVFKKLRNAAPMEIENLLIELLNLDYIIEENYKYSSYYIMENYNKVLEYYDNQNNALFRNSFDKFISNANFKYLFENEFIRSLFEKESSKFFDTKNLKALNTISISQNNLQPSTFEYQEHMLTKDNQYFLRQMSNNNLHLGDQTTRNEISSIFLIIKLFC